MSGEFHGALGGGMYNQYQVYVVHTGAYLFLRLFEVIVPFLLVLLLPVLLLGLGLFRLLFFLPLLLLLFRLLLFTGTIILFLFGTSPREVLIKNCLHGRGTTQNTPRTVMIHL